MISFYKHNLKKDKNYLKRTISSPYLTSGPVGENVEELLKKRFKKKYYTTGGNYFNDR